MPSDVNQCCRGCQERHQAKPIPPGAPLPILRLLCCPDHAQQCLGQQGTEITIRKACFRWSAQLLVQKVAEPAVAGLQLILMLDCFIVLCELPLYIALLTHRFVISTRKVKVVTWLCMLWSVALRVLEGVILIAYFAGTYDRMKR